MISLIVAASSNNVIGSQGALPWRLAADLRRFKALTMGKPIVMGRRTFESIGRPLPGRQNIVITRRSGYVAQGCDVVASPQAAIEAAGAAAEIMIIGGSQVYAAFLPGADRIYLTRVEADLPGDTRLPDLVTSEWTETAREPRAADADNDYDTTFLVLERARGMRDDPERRAANGVRG